MPDDDHPVEEGKTNDGRHPRLSVKLERQADQKVKLEKRKKMDFALGRKTFTEGK